MAIEVSTPPPDDDGAIDVEVVEPGRLSRLKDKAAPHTVRASAVLAMQRANVTRRLAEWFTATDITDEQLAREIEAKRARAARQGELELRKRATVLRAQLNAASPERAAGLASQLADIESQMEIRRNAEALVKVDLVRARWGKKAGRMGAVALGGIAYVNGVAAEPLLALASLVAAPVAWWWLARPHASEPGQAAAVAPVPDHPGEVKPVPADALFVPQALADAGRTSLIKRDPAHVRGEADLVTALVKAGIISEAQRDETHLAGVIQPAGPGWTATVELPRDAKASVAVGKIENLASALRIKKSRIEISADTTAEGHEGRFVLWVADHDNPYGTGKHPSALMDAPSWDFWKHGVPLGADARGERHTMHLLWSSLLIGGLQDYGKSYLARLIAAAAVLDSNVRIIVITGKTGPDWAPLRHVAHQWIAGASPDIIRKVLGVMESTITEMQNRGSELDRIFEDDPDAVPEGKITPELAATGMGPVLLVVDELQELLDGANLIRVPVDEDPDGGGRTATRSGKDLLVEAFARYVRVTRFVGGMGLFVTQRPDSDSVPTKLREVCVKRGSFRVKGAKSAKMVLGDDAVDAGAAPHLLGEASKGVVVLDQGAEQGHVTLKSDVIDVPDFKGICLRGRDLRVAAGTLTGDAVNYGQTDAGAAAAARLLADCLEVLDRAGVDRARTERLGELLAAHDPGRYGELTNAQLQARLRDAGVGTTRKLGPIDGMVSPNGYLREQIAAAREKGGK